jgi:CDP-diacylglycerol---serine O-phosphatidyltransferase
MAIVFALNTPESYFKSAIMVCLAAAFDTLDGRFARLLGVSGDFGRELDSLADVVSFGVAPAILVYQHSLHSAGLLGMAVAGLFVCCGAGRLARYNINASGGKSRFFTGMPIPMAGMLGASISLYQHQINVTLVIFVILLAALVMSHDQHDALSHPGADRL